MKILQPRALLTGLLILGAILPTNSYFVLSMSDEFITHWIKMKRITLTIATTYMAKRHCIDTRSLGRNLHTIGYYVDQQKAPVVTRSLALLSQQKYHFTFISDLMDHWNEHTHLHNVLINGNFDMQPLVIHDGDGNLIEGLYVVRIPWGTKYTILPKNNTPPLNYPQLEYTTPLRRDEEDEISLPSPETPQETPHQLMGAKRRQPVFGAELYNELPTKQATNPTDEEDFFITAE